MADEWSSGTRDRSDRSPLQQGGYEASREGGPDVVPPPLMGAEVRGADGGYLGRVAAAWPAYVLVEPSPGAPTDYWVPVEAFVGYEGEALVLTVPRAEADRRGWAERPVGGPDRPR